MHANLWSSVRLIKVLVFYQESNLKSLEKRKAYDLTEKLRQEIKFQCFHVKQLKHVEKFETQKMLRKGKEVVQHLNFDKMWQLQS